MYCMYILLLNVFLLSIGMLILLNKQSVIFFIIGIELVIQSVISNLIFFTNLHSHQLEGIILATFVIFFSVCEIILALAILITLYNQFKAYYI